ncbi:hypothetical protein [Shimia biformata]|uniref:FliH/SctL family protein n=1 Tax=Shimia biformata TaxID=1294299 RepID=UPI001951D43C|nr:hypothetical protein [Shimia biformata]
MSTIAHLLEDFTALTPETQGTDGAPAGESELLDSFEQGYKAGWDDAIKAKSDNATNVSDDLAQNLRDLSFTFHEAHAAMMAEVTSVLDDIVAAAIPDILHATMGERLKSELLSLAESQSDQPAHIRAHPDDLDAVSSSLPDSADLPVKVLTDPALTPGRVEFQLGGRERALDVSDIARDIVNAVTGLKDETAARMPHSNGTQMNKDVAYG